jgi:hypothetical protein
LIVITDRGRLIAVGLGLPRYRVGIGYSQRWKWSAEERVSEGDPEDWAAVARVIGDRVRELGWPQRELAECSHVPVAVVREIQRHTVERRRSRRTLEALFVALGWEPGCLDQVLKGRAEQAGSRAKPDNGAPRFRLDLLEQGLDEIFKLFAELRSGLAAVIDHARDDL